MAQTYSGEVTLRTEAAPQLESEGISILPDPPEAKADETKLRYRWALVFAPWAWFIVRGLHSWLEVIAILLPVLTVVGAGLALLLAAYRRSAVLAALSASLLLLFAVTTFLPGRPVNGPQPVETSQFASTNLASQWFSDNEIGFFVYDQEPDVLVGIELREPHDIELRSRFTNGVSDIIDTPNLSGPDFAGTYRENSLPSIGIYTDLPMEVLEDPIADTIPGGLPGFRVRVSTETSDVIVYALHVPRPGPGSGLYEVTPPELHAMVDALADAVEAEELPVVVMGDLNLVDRGPGFQRLTENLSDAMRADRWADSTRTRDLWHTILKLRIDHVLVSPELCVADAIQDRVLFSDHDTIQANVGLCSAN